MSPDITEYCTIDYYGKIARGKSKHRPRNDPSLFGGKYPFIQTGDVKHAHFYIDEYATTYNEKGLAQSKLWDEDTLCITIAANIADTAILNMKACFPDSVIGFAPYKDRADVRYIKYSLETLKQQIESISKGTTQDNLSLEKLRSVNFRLTPFPTQKKIAAVLSAYDELIENNNRRIAILEKMAEELYREWFVRLRFPGHEKVKIEKGIPEGWETYRLSELMSFEKGRTPRFLYEEKKSETDVYLSIDMIENDVKKYAPLHNSVVCEETEPLMIMDGARSSYVYIGYKGIISSTFSAIRSDKRLRFMFYEYLKANRETMIFNNTGSAIPHANKDFIYRMLVKIPSEGELIVRFNEIYEPMFRSKLRLKKRNQLLKQSRDLLLPRLISGKLDVEDLDIRFPPGMREEGDG